MRQVSSTQQLVLFEVLVQFPLKLPGRRQIMAERLLHGDHGARACARRTAVFQPSSATPMTGTRSRPRSSRR